MILKERKKSNHQEARGLRNSPITQENRFCNYYHYFCVCLQNFKRMFCCQRTSYILRIVRAPYRWRWEEVDHLPMSVFSSVFGKSQTYPRGSDQNPTEYFSRTQFDLLSSGDLCGAMAALQPS